MNRTEVRDALFPNCPIRNVLTRIGDKWSLLVLFTMERNGNQRFKELQRNIPDI
jgi:DNA-binding HxlR family transcriptional regulator